jgi:hypothetical protein
MHSLPSLSAVGGGVSVGNGPAHPNLLMHSAVAAHAAVQLRGIGAMLQVVPAARRQSSIQPLPPLLVSPGEPKHPIRGQPEVTEHRPEQLARVDSLQELQPHLDGQACLRSGFLQARLVSLCARHVTASVAEFRCTAATTTQAGSTRSVDDKPLAVVTAGEQTGDWLQMQDEPAALPSNSIHRIVAGASHASLLFTDRDAAVSSTTIDEVVHSVRAHRPLRR